MPSNYAIGALGYPGLGATDYQALAALMNTPNPYSQVSFQGGGQTMSQPQVQYVQQTKEKNSKAPWALLGTGILLVGAGFYFASKGRADLKGLEKLKDGAKTVWNNISGKVATTATEAASTATEAATKGKNTIAEVVDKSGKTHQVVTLAGEKNVIYNVKNNIVSNPNAQAKLGEIGLEVPKTGNIASRVKSGTNTLMDGNKLLHFWQFTRIGGEDVLIIGAHNSKGEQIITIVGKGKDGKFSRKLLSGDGISAKNFKKAEQIAKDIFSGKTDLATVDKILLKHTDKATGAISTIESKKGAEKLLSVVTDRFSINSTKVKWMRSNNPSFDKALTEFIDNNGKKLGILRADIPVTGGPTFTVDNKGNVLAIKYKDHGKIVVVDKTKNPELFGAKMFDFREQAKGIPNVKPENWVNRVFEAVL